LQEIKFIFGETCAVLGKILFFVPVSAKERRRGEKREN
jgi:hypothetical protein